MTNQLNFDEQTATEYDRGIRRTLPTYDALFRLVQAYFRQQLQEDSELLIIGAGGGSELALLGPQNPTWTFTAVDPSRAMLDLAKEKAKQVKLTNRVHFIEGTVEAVDVAPVYDAATCMLVLHFIESDDDKVKLLQHIRKRLKNGAPFVLATLYGEPESPEFDTLFSLWKAYWLDTTDLSEDEVNEMEKTVRKLSFLPEEKIVEILNKAGFGNIAKFFTTNMFGGWICRVE